MRKIANVSLLLSLLLFTTLILQAQSRPRRVGGTANTQTQQQSEPETQQTAPATQKRPVLQTGTTVQSSNRTPTTQTSQPTTSKSNEPEEVGEDDVVRVSTTLVSIPVSVMDRQGRFTLELRKGAFRIYEGGVEQKADAFASVEMPFTVSR